MLNSKNGKKYKSWVHIVEMSEMINKNNKLILKWLVNNQHKNNKLIQNIINLLIFNLIRIQFFLKAKIKIKIFQNKIKKILIVKTLIYYNWEDNNCKNWKKYKDF